MTEEIKEQEMTYEEELALLKKKWAVRKAEERKAKAEQESKKEREENATHVMKALEEIKAVKGKTAKELDCVIIRLEMYLKGERYTRNMNKGGDK